MVKVAQKEGGVWRVVDSAVWRGTGPERYFQYTVHPCDSTLPDSHHVSPVYERMTPLLRLKSLKRAGLFAFPDYAALKKQFGKEKTELDSVGDGWLISMDICGCLRSGIRRILGIQAFRCIPSHIYGRGQYANLCRKYGAKIISLDFDSGLPDVNIQNRIHLLIDGVIE